MLDTVRRALAREECQKLVASIPFCAQETVVSMRNWSTSKARSAETTLRSVIGSTLSDFTQSDPAEQREILTALWQFLEWLQARPVAGRRQLLHVLTHLMFPDVFERISSGGDKESILAAFTEVAIPVGLNC